MKVLQINSVCGIRSTGRICTDIADALEKQGHECKIVYGRELVPERYQKYAVRVGWNLTVKLDALKARLFDNAGLNSKKATKRLVSWIKKYNPDVIHLHNLHGYYINIEILFQYLKTCGKKIVWTLHDCWAFTGHCSHFSYVNCNQWKTCCLKCLQHREYPKSLFLDRAKRNYLKKKKAFMDIPNMTIVTPSYWLAELVKDSFLKEYPIEVIPNGIDLTMFRPTESKLREQYGLQDKKIVLAVASAWGGRKGFFDLIRLSELLDETYQLVMVGVTPKQKKKIPENIFTIERTNSVRELAEWYTAADVFVNPTKEDTFPTTNLEAIACGTPIITYPTGGSIESVSIDNGFITKDCRIERVKDLIPEALKLDSQIIINTASKYNKVGQYQKYIILYGRQ